MSDTPKIDGCEQSSPNRMKRRRKFAASAAILAAAAVILLVLSRGCVRDKSGIPTLTIETPEKMEESDRNPLSLELRLSSLGDALYPAASFSISFDPSRLEFLGVDEGNITVPGDSPGVRVLPEWNVNTDRSNKTGCVNIMYLDLTGGGHAFEKSALPDDSAVVLRLRFRLRGSVRSGDICTLAFEDAVFAASDESESLSSSAGTLRTVNGKIIVK